MIKKITEAILALLGGGPDRTVKKVVRTIHAPSGKRRLGIFLRGDGTYIFQEDAFNDRFDVGAWEPAQTGPAKELCHTPEEALDAARKTVPWLWEIPE
jgi:hypothetical protein